MGGVGKYDFTEGGGDFVFIRRHPLFKKIKNLFFIYMWWCSKVIEVDKWRDESPGGRNRGSCVKKEERGSYLSVDEHP